MKYLLAATAAFSLATAAGGAFASTTIDFNALSGTFTSYSQAGATFTSVGGGQFVSTLDPNGTNGLLETSSPRHLLRADIAGGTNFVSVDLGDFDSDPDLLTLQAFDAANNSLGLTTLLIDASFTGMKTLSLSVAGIDHAIFGSMDPSINGSSVYIDNFTFAGHGVPEPAVWTMMIAGFALAGLGLRGRRRAPGAVAA